MVLQALDAGRRVDSRRSPGAEQLVEWRKKSESSMGSGNTLQTQRKLCSEEGFLSRNTNDICELSCLSPFGWVGQA